MSDFRLKVFQSVAKNLSFTKASQELFVSQPAITKHIQELEAAYQTRLFDRQGSRISLTEAGKLLLEHCERILEDYKRLEYEMHLLHNEYTGGLKLGASTTVDVSGKYGKYQVVFGAYGLFGDCFHPFHYS